MIQVYKKGGDIIMQILREAIDFNVFQEDVDDCSNFCHGLCCLQGTCCKGC